MQAIQFMDSVFPVPEAGCWLWGKATRADGYGVQHHNGKAVKTHRLAWELMVGPIPDGACVLHKCDVRSCCNPAHLYIGDRKQNARDMVERKRLKSANKAKTHCKHGHEFTPENTMRYGPQRKCRICNTAQNRAASRMRSLNRSECHHNH